MKLINRLKRFINYLSPKNSLAKIRFRILKLAKIHTPFFQRSKLKLNIGSAEINNSSEWYPTDKNNLDITKEQDWQKVLYSLRLNNIVAEHVWEHLSLTEADLANANCFKYLKKGGILRIAVPDGYNPNKEYIESVRPGGTGKGAGDHKMLYNYKIISDNLQKAGFETKLLEYWDDNGKFHYEDWNNDNGLIIRSRRYDPRNNNGVIKYTSLIIDAIKP